MTRASDPGSPDRPVPPPPGGGSGTGSGAGSGTGPTPRRPAEPRVTRAGVMWVAVVAALVLFVLLVVFFIQNQDLVLVRFLGFDGAVPLGLALFIAAVAGGVLVAVVGAVRIVQLRAATRRALHHKPTA